MFNTFFSPVINSAGQVSFKSILTGSGVDATNNLGLWSEGTGSLNLVARRGGAATGTPTGVVFDNILGHLINDAGQTAFRGQVAGVGADSSNDQGIWSEGSGSLVLIAREGSSAPGTGAGAEFSSMLNPLLNDAGQVAFRAELRGSSVHSNNRGIWSEGPGSLSLLARREFQAPGLDAGVNFDGLGIPVLNSLGQTAFLGNLNGTGINSLNDSAIWSEGSGSLSIVAREGDSATGTGIGVVFKGFAPDVAINDAGHTAFLGLLVGTGVNSTNEVGMWSGVAGALELVWREGDAAPGTPDGTVFDGSDIEEPLINSQGEIAFRGTVIGSGINSGRHKGIWTGVSGALDLVALEGAEAPGTSTGVKFNSFNKPVLNGAGQTAFVGSITGTSINGANDVGIWATDPGGILVLIAREGDLFDVNDDPLAEDLRTISGLSMIPNTGGEDGRANPFNDAGQLALHLGFTDGSEGIFVATIPEPGALAVLGLGMPMLLRQAWSPRNRK